MKFIAAHAHLFSGGNPYGGYGECDVMVKLKTNQYRMPKPDHISEDM